VLIAAHRPAKAIAPLERALAIRANLAGAVAAVAADSLPARPRPDRQPWQPRARPRARQRRARRVRHRARHCIGQEIDTWRAEIGRAR